MARVALACLAAAIAGVCGCEAILGMDGHDAHLAAFTPAGDAGATVDAGAEPCVLPSTGDATLRAGNLVPSTARVDVCLRRSGTASPLDGKPVLASSRGTCPAGIGYKDVTAPFKVQSGTYSVALVPAGGPCTAAPVASGQITVATNAGAAVYLLGDGATPATALPIHEDAPLGEVSEIRFIDAVSGSGGFDLGLVTGASLPATIQSIMFSGVTFGAVGVPSTKYGINDNGYAQLTLLGGAIPVGAAPAGAADVTLIADPPLSPGDAYSAFAIGSPTDPSYPEELYVCNERGIDGAFTQCANGGGTSVTVDVFDPFLWGPFSPLQPLREPAVVAAVAALTSDVVCIPDAFGDAVTQEILARAKETFPYVVHFADTLATTIDDPAMQDGGLPPAPTIPPCGAGNDAYLEPFLDCLSAYCTAPLNAPDAAIMENAAACITNNCASAAEGLLLTSDLQQLKCWNCAFFNVQGGATIEDTRAACTTDVNAGYAFNGQSGVSILSKYPITGAEQWVLPSINWRSNIIRAPLGLPGGKRLDAYCAILSDPSSSITLPYTGAYGNGSTNVDGWHGELDIQAQKLVAYVKRKSAGIPAVIGGQFYGGPSAADGTTPFNTDAYQPLSAAFPVAATASGPPGCTLCATNPILSPPGETPSATSALSSYALLANIPVTDVVSASIELQSPILDAGTTEAGLPYFVPLSTYYDYRATIRVRP